MASAENKRIDMHMHSTYSDGVRTPAELIDMAKAKGLAGIALTDHDSMEGFAELSAAAVTAHVEVMTGVVLSCGVDAADAPLQTLLRDFRGARERRGERIVEKLAEQGVHIEMSHVMAK